MAKGSSKAFAGKENDCEGIFFWCRDSCGWDSRDSRDTSGLGLVKFDRQITTANNKTTTITIEIEISPCLISFVDFFGFEPSRATFGFGLGSETWITFVVGVGKRIASGDEINFSPIFELGFLGLFGFGKIRTRRHFTLITLSHYCATRMTNELHSEVKFIFGIQGILWSGLGWVWFDSWVWLGSG